MSMKLRGATYMEVHEMGGGIGFTVRHTHSASDEKLKALLKKRLDQMLSLGTTLAEIKTGYGLIEEEEIRQLRLMKEVCDEHDIDVVGTYLGAHSVPVGETADSATEKIVTSTIPKIKNLQEKGEILPSIMVDVFCEKGIFELEHSKRILQAGKDHGMLINFHGDELNYTKSGELAGELGARAMSHCEKVSPKGIEMMAKVHTSAVVLPTTSYMLRLEHAPARALISGGVPLAIATDHNAGQPTLSLPLTLHQACVFYKMSCEEALMSGTINAAWAIGKSETHGSLEEGKVADFLVLEAPCWESLIVQWGMDQFLPIKQVFKSGKCVRTK
eukprot:gnl/Carplike_NY0171/4786_a6521_200.p1 GENE.gnl/Carplike_NY0171/4786_a6521_200~~gnl/Carplike_NY0171/4786_a6521_200.p1  ORF type:complete len:367 (-),score=96.59 gnl/Carplike_NY0171/4786_a6521_200:126-1115(-)